MTTRRARFEAFYPKIADELVVELSRKNVPKDALEWYRKSLDYNVPGGKLHRGMSVVDTVEILKCRPLSDEEYCKAAVLGWCIELLQGAFTVGDDIMDASFTRRWQPCWYRKPGVGMVAINDAFMLGSSLRCLLRIYFKKDPCYVGLLELFSEITFKSSFGQLMDVLSAPEDVDLNRFSLERNHLINVYKTAYYSTYLPVACAMYMCGIPHSTPSTSNPCQIPAKDPYEVAKSILLPLGTYFQIRDDFLDYSGDPDQIGKIGTDIIDNKCSWCINTALLYATPAQRKILEENYGVKPSGGENELKVKAIFDEIGLKEKYTAYEERAISSIRARIDEIEELKGENVLKKEVFESLLVKLYKKRNQTTYAPRTDSLSCLPTRRCSAFQVE